MHNESRNNFYHIRRFVHDMSHMADMDVNVRTVTHNERDIIHTNIDFIRYHQYEYEYTSRSNHVYVGNYRCRRISRR